MQSFIPLLAVVCAAVAQQTSFKPQTGVRSLWIPYLTVSGTPLASIASNNSAANETVYVISCPTADLQCPLAPNLTLTEGISHVQYTTSNSNGKAVLGCDMTGTTSAVCSEDLNGNGQVAHTQKTLAASDIIYRAIDVTSTNNNTATMPQTVTVTAKTTSSSSSSSSSSTRPSTGGATATSGPWAMGGAIGAGLLALAAL